jgi:glucokinase
LRAVSVTPEGDVIAKASRDAGGQIARADLLTAIENIVREVSAGGAPQSIGVALGGKIELDGTMHIGSTNLPNLAGLPLVETFLQRLGFPCRLDNDGRATMRGEAWLGAARGLRNALAMTFGTAIGGGLLLNGEIYAGSHRGAGEIGVWRLAPPPMAGDWPTVEEIAAPSRIARRFGHGLDQLIAASAADPAAQGAIDEIFEPIGRAIANAHLLLDLDAVVLFGGVTAIGEPFRLAVERAFLRACPQNYRHGLLIKLSALGTFSGAVGAAALWLDEVAP